MRSVRKIAILGNSHIGALKGGWTEISHLFPMIEITFFGRPNGRGGLDSLESNNDKLIPIDPELTKWLIKTSGKGYIEVKNFDCFVIYGFGGSINFLYNGLGINNRIFYSSQLLQLYDKNCVEKLAANTMNTAMYRLPKMVRSISNVPIYIFHRPLLSNSSDISDKNKELGKIFYPRYIEELYRLYDSKLNCRLMSQPKETISDQIFTHEHFTLPNDHLHMNSNYGKIILDSLLKEYLNSSGMYISQAKASKSL